MCKRARMRGGPSSGGRLQTAGEYDAGSKSHDAFTWATHTASSTVSLTQLEIILLCGTLRPAHSSSLVSAREFLGKNFTKKREPEQSVNGRGM